MSPLGALELDSHHAPVRLDVDVDQLDPGRSQALVKHPGGAGRRPRPGGPGRGGSPAPGRRGATR
nr:hypothetical protein C5F59_20125 [Streptomyces sp. QL37]